jgi:hypothetical protein
LIERREKLEDIRTWWAQQLLIVMELTIYVMRFQADCLLAAKYHS